jgi:hypothetical protein
VNFIEPDPLQLLQDLPWREGPRPSATRCAPHQQLDQFPQVSLRMELLQRVSRLDGVTLGSTRRGPRGTIGLHLCGCERSAPPGAFMIDEEFAHVHPDGDASMHLVLPEPLRSQAVERGWAEPHPLAGHPMVPKGIVLLYAPRTMAELQVAVALVQASWRHARAGHDELPQETFDGQ